MSDRTNKLIICWAVPLALLLLYAVTAQRGVSWQDSGEFQYRVLIGDFRWHLGIALAHPLYIFGAGCFTRCFPESLTFYATALFSGLGMVTALILLSLTLWRLTANRWAVVTATVTLGLSQMCWWMSTVAEVYTWSLAFLMAEVFCLLAICSCKHKTLRWWLALAFINGLHASLHNFAFLNLPVYGVLFFIRKDGIKTLLSCVLAWMLGAALLLCLFYLELKTLSFGATIKSLFFGYGYEGAVLNTRHINWKLAFVNFALASVSFASPCWLFATRGFNTLREHITFKRCLLALTGIHFVFWVRYFVPDQATFLLPTLGLLAIWLGVGCASVPLKTKTLALCLTAGIICQIAIPLALCAVAARYEITHSRTLPFRQDVPYWLLPWKHNEASAQQFVDEVEKMLDDNDVLIADSTSAHPLMALRAIRKKPSTWRLVSLYSGETEEDLLALTQRPDRRVFVVSPVRGYTPDVLLKTKRFEESGVLYRVLEVP